VEYVLRSTANRVGAALIVSGLLIASALMARVNDYLATVMFGLAAAIGLYISGRSRGHRARSES
jgi:hypothetical protein